MRKVDIWYSFNDEEIYITLNDETLCHYVDQSVTYIINDFKDWTDLYNKLLEDFEAEYDDKVANALEVICKQFWKENKLCDSVTQE